MAKAKGKTKDEKKTLMVDSNTHIPDLEKVLASGNITIVLVYAEWCGACHRFREKIWDPMLKDNAIHNRIAVRDDMVKNTSLSKAKFDYLPSILVVDEKGDIQTFRTPEGEETNAMPTPKSIEDMTRIVNVPLGPLGSKAPSVPLAPRPVNVIENYEKLDEVEVKAKADEAQEAEEEPNWLTNQITPKPENYNYTHVIRTYPIPTPKGTTYIPIEKQVQRGGSLLKTLKSFIGKNNRIKSHKKKTRGLKIGRQTRKHK
uniref:Thioredoxin domain-containing protein n=1 Tax=viral metagenome TaxID=1070528 RepID=A0A6C0KNA4_9ZZZZ